MRQAREERPKLVARRPELGVRALRRGGAGASERAAPQSGASGDGACVGQGKSRTKRTALPVRSRMSPGDGPWRCWPAEPGGAFEATALLTHVAAFGIALPALAQLIGRGGDRQITGQANAAVGQSQTDPDEIAQGVIGVSIGAVGPLSSGAAGEVWISGWRWWRQRCRQSHLLS